MDEFLKLLRNKQHNDQVAKSLAQDGIRWKFNPPAAPHFGGLWEAGVKSVKFHLKRVMGNEHFNYEEMITVLHKIEACLNSRPLSPMSTDPSDLNALTPGHFLVGDSLVAIPGESLTGVPMNRLDRWQLLQQTVQHFWKRWSGEYLTRLQQRPKWWTPKADVVEGILVLIKDNNLPPQKWKLARVVQLHPGPDGHTRVVTLKTLDGELKRPITKLSLLPLESEEKTEDTL
ncbi:unnamed protein product [Allacma fusca]|uniref:DUF5641 domain-containing protein n=1 Tax=Allacma fusca TaxID=39272 RepID=A0A8J2P549_9HEXA|nr:unnamed protein product [Allacma fusca]